MSFRILNNQLRVVLSLESTRFATFVVFGLFLLLLTERDEYEIVEFSEAMAWNSERSVRECINRRQVSLFASCH